jgi:hypothetical protein
MSNEDGYVVEEASGGRKNDGGKPRWELFEFDFLEEVAKVLTFGAEKYDDNNWKLVSSMRYVGAIYRHLKSFVSGESRDAETGLHHLAHATCCMMFLFWMDVKKEDCDLRCLNNENCAVPESVAPCAQDRGPQEVETCPRCTCFLSAGSKCSCPETQAANVMRQAGEVNVDQAQAKAASALEETGKILGASPIGKEE